MAKLNRTLRAPFDTVLRQVEQGIVNGSVSATLEDGSDMRTGHARCSVRVFERYSAMGGNRVSLSVTLAGSGDALFLSAITSGGSQAMFFKVNTWGESAFLDSIRDALDTL